MRSRWVFFLDTNLNSWAVPFYIRRVIMTGMSFMFHLQILCFDFIIGRHSDEYMEGR